jgi:hypothetical protein
VGETARAICLVDNTHCDKDVKCIKFKWRRLIHTKSKNGTRTFKKHKTLSKLEFPGMPSGKSGEVKVEMPLMYTKDLETFEAYLKKQ